MKKVILFLFCIGVFSSNVTGQMSKGQISYEVEVSSEVENMKDVIPKLEGSTFEVYFSEAGVRTELYLGEIVSLYSVSSVKAEEVLLYMNNVNTSNKGVVVSKANLDEGYSNANIQFEVKLQDDIKEIAGYECKKAIVTDVNGNEFVYWYTEDIKVDKNYANYINRELPGMPLEFEFVQDDLTLKFTTILIEKEIKDLTLFDVLLAEEYKEWTFEEMWIYKPK